MGFKDVFDVFKRERKLNDDQAALLTALRGASDPELEQLRDLLIETLGPSPKASKPVVKRKIEHCGVTFDGYPCGLTKRAQIHKDPNAPDYHEFQVEAREVMKSARARSLGKAIAGKSPQPPHCVACYEIEDHENHGDGPGQHGFETKVGERSQRLMDPDRELPERCTAIREDSKPCNLVIDHNVHQMKMVQGYHEFQSAVSEAVAAASGD